MCYFRGSSLKTVPPAFNLTRHCSLFRSIAHFPESLLTFSKINKVRYFYQTFLFQIYKFNFESTTLQFNTFNLQYLYPIYLL